MTSASALSAANQTNKAKPTDFYVAKLYTDDDSKFCTVQSVWTDDDIKFHILEFSNETKTIAEQWEGHLLMDDFEKSAIELGIAFGRIYQECQLVFCSNTCDDISSSSNKEEFSYRIENNTFILQKNGRFRCTYMEMRLQNVQNLTDRLILEFMTLINIQKNKLKESELKLTNLNMEHTSTLHSIQETLGQKIELEANLYSKFAAILNAKKDRIAQLEKLLNENKATSKQNEIEIFEDT